MYSVVRYRRSGRPLSPSARDRAGDRDGDNVYTGAGSVITEDFPEGALGIARARQPNVEDYAKRNADD